MPPRGSTTIHHLPDDLLARCLEPLQVKDRLASVALVSKRFSAVAAMSRRLSLRFGLEGAGGTAAILRRFRSLQPWLLKHGHALQELELGCDVRSAEAAGILESCLTAATGGGSGSLRCLQLVSSVAGDGLLALGGWASLNRLQQLDVWFDGKLHLFISLEGACRLQRLSLTANDFEVGGAARLPPSMTKLACRHVQLQLAGPGNLHDLQARLLLPAHEVKVGNLSCLRSLTLSWQSAGWERPANARPPGGLSMLRALQHLAVHDFSDVGWLPAVAPHLLSLQVLEIMYDCQLGGQLARRIAGSVDSSLRALPQLRGLSLDADMDGPPFPAAATALSSLQWLHLARAGGFGLPAGPWQRSLRRVVLGPLLATASAAFLEGSPKLEHVTLRWPLYAGIPWDSKHHWDAFFDWAAQHPPLCRLDWPLEVDDRFDSFLVPPEVMLAMLKLAQRRPELCLECPGHEVEDEDFFRDQLLPDWA